VHDYINIIAADGFSYEACGNEVIASDGRSGRIDMTGSNYRDELYCLWEIQAQSNIQGSCKIEWKFDFFDVENAPYCKYDRVLVDMGRNGATGRLCWTGQEQS